MTKHALVTGGAGFIGSHLVERLLCDGWSVRVLDNFSTGNQENLRTLQNDIEVIAGDVRDLQTCRKACAKVDSVFHLAAIASVVNSVEDPALSHEVTLGGTLNMLLASRDAGARRFVFSSSAAVYGNSDIVPTGERQTIDPCSPYASDKACGEFYCRNFYALYGIETVILRYFNVFGPRQSARSSYAAVIPRFIEAAIEGRAPTVYGDGRQTRDFVYVTNVVHANLQSILADRVAGHTFNIAGGESISLLDLLAIIERVTGTPLSPQFLEARPGEVRHSRADISLARDMLHYEPAVSVAVGLKRTLEAAKAALESDGMLAAN